MWRDEEEELFPLLLRHVQSQPAPLREARVQHMQLEGFARKVDIAVAAGIVDRETSEVVEVGDGRWEVRASGPLDPDMTRDLIGEVRHFLADEQLSGTRLDGTSILLHPEE